VDNVTVKYHSCGKRWILKVQGWEKKRFSHAEIQDHVDKYILWVNDDLWNLRY